MNPSSFSLFDPKPFQAPAKGFPVAETVSLYGPEALSDAQLMEAMLNRVRPGRAEQILTQVGTLGRLIGMGPTELEALGLTRTKMGRFAILQEVQRRSSRGIDTPRITSPRAAGTYLLPKVQGWTEERFGMLALNAKGKLMADRTLSQGTATATLISPREFFRETLRFGAPTALAWHNHPSGDPTRPSPRIVPSQPDYEPSVKAWACHWQITWSWAATAGIASGLPKGGIVDDPHNQTVVETLPKSLINSKWVSCTF